MRRCTWLSHLLSGPILLFLATAEARPPKKPPPPKEEKETPPPQQDPMEIEHSTAVTQPIVTPPPPPPPPPHANGHAQSQGQPTPQPAQPAPVEKAGRFMANFRIGAAPCLNSCAHEGALGLELGYSVLPNKNAYLVLPVQFHFGPLNSAVIVPLGFQYDLAVPRTNNRLYFYPRLSIGYALYIDHVSPGQPKIHSGILIPELGLKYVWRGRYNFGGEFFSLPVLFGQLPSGDGFVSVYYRVMLSVGVNF